MHPRDHAPMVEPTRSGRLALLFLALLVPSLLACSAAPAAPSPTAPPDSPISTGPGVVPSPPDGIEPPIVGGAVIVEPQDDLIDLRPVTWEKVDVAADGRTLTVYWTGGVDTCYGLGDVEVERRDDGTLAVGLWEGTKPEAVNQACIEIAMLKATVVTLDDPLIVPLLGGSET